MWFGWSLCCTNLFSWSDITEDVGHSDGLNKSYDKTNVISNTQEDSGNLIRRVRERREREGERERKEREGGRGRERWREREREREKEREMERERERERERGRGEGGREGSERYGEKERQKIVYKDCTCYTLIKSITYWAKDG